MSLVRLGKRYRTYYGNDDSILLTEFEFHNKNKKVMPKKRLNEIKNELNDDKKVITWSNKTLINYGIYFVFYVEDGSKIVEIKETPMKASLDDIEDLMYIFNKEHFIKFKLDDGVDDYLSNLGRKYSFPKPSGDKPIIHTSFDTLAKVLIKDNYISDGDWSYFSSIQHMIDLILPGTKLEKAPLCKQRSVSYRTAEILYISDVFEKRIDDKNYRLVILSRPDRYREDYEYRMEIYSEDDELYFQMDKGRLVVAGCNRTYLFIDNNDIEYDGKKMLIDNNLFYYIKRDEDRLFAKGQYVIPASIYRFYKDKVLQFEEYSNGDNGLTSQEVAILNKYRELLNKGKEIKMDNLKINPNTIKLTNENFSIGFEKKFLDIGKNLGVIKKALAGEDVRYNFNEFYEKLIGMSCLKVIKPENTHMEKYKTFDKVKIKVNNIRIKIHKDENRMKINDIFCRIGDVQHLLSRAICYNTVEDYNAYIKDVSYIGSDWMTMISTGCLISLSNPFYSAFNKIGAGSYEKVLLRFSLTRDVSKRNIVYLILNGEKYQIKYKGKFKRYFNYPKLNMTLRDLKRKLSECIEGIDDENIISIIDNAVKEAEMIQKRGQELVEETVKDINAKEGEFDINGKKMIGYKLIGRVTGTEYFIQKSSLAVFRLQEGRWNRRCVVDDYNKQRIFEDKLANRLVNIYNEPTYIYTLH